MTNAEQVDYNFYETGSIASGTSGIGCKSMDEYIFLIVQEPVPIHYFFHQIGTGSRDGSFNKNEVHL